MKQKTSLMLLELVIMLLVFAVAAAVCMCCFAWAQDVTQKSVQTDEAYLQLQTAAEQLKGSAGDYEALGARLEDGVYYLPGTDLQLQIVPLKTGIAGLAGATLTAVREDRTLGDLTVYWQEVVP